ncbi:MAG: HAMP domain-containing sensor histidine kinase [Prolixibacteraceae bacterium]
MVTKNIFFGQGSCMDNSTHGRENDSGDAQYAKTIISSISHELSTSVAVISSNIQLFQRFSYDISQQVRDETFFLCGESLKDVSRFLDNIQILNSINKSRLTLENSTVDLKKSVRDLYRELKLMNLDHKRIILKWKLRDKIIVCDRRLLSRILINALSNSLKFSKEAVYLTISTDSRGLFLTVQDHGIGIPERQIDQVFQPFYRASNASHIAGVGLGLAIVYSLVQKVKGEIRLSSAIGEGVILKINIPYECPRNTDH